MSPWFEAALMKYGWIWVGLTFGFAAKYALLIKRGTRIQPRLIAADVLLLPIVALIAYSIVTQAGAKAEAAALLTSFCTVCADRLIKLLAERFLGQVDTALGEAVQRRKGEIRQEVQLEISGAEVVRDIATGKRSLD